MSNNNWQEEAMRRLRQMQQAGGSGGRPQMPRGMGGAAVGGMLLLGGAMFFSNALFNVDGGHRAIKYRRISGVSPEIYNEGMQVSTRGSSRERETIRMMEQHTDSLQERTSTSLGSRPRSSTTCERSRETWHP